MYVEYIEWITTYTSYCYHWNKTIVYHVYKKLEQIIAMFNADIPDVVAPVFLIPSVHSRSLGSGSQSPFPIHVDELDPLSV